MKHKKFALAAGLLLAAALLAAALVLLNRPARDTGTVTLSPYKLADITQFSYSGNNVEVELAKDSSGVWRLTSDPTLPLQQEAVESLAESYTALTAQRRLTGDDLTDLPARSQNPAMLFTLTTADGSAAFTVDSLNPVTDTYYVYDETGVAYVVARADLASLCKSPRKLYQSQTLTDAAAADVTRLQVGELDLVQTDGTWTLAEDAAAQIDQNAVNKMVNTVLQAQTKWTVTMPQESAAYGLEEPDVQATLTFTDGTTLTMCFGAACTDAEDEDLCYMSADSTPTVVYEVLSAYKNAFAVTKETLLEQQ